MKLGTALLCSTLVSLVSGGSRDSGSTVDEGYSATYSESSEWSNDSGDSKSDSNYGSYTEYYSSYTDYSSNQDRYDSRGSQGHKSSDPPANPLVGLFVICGYLVFVAGSMCYAKIAADKLAESKRQEQERRLKKIAALAESVEVTNAPEPGTGKPIFSTGPLSLQASHPALDPVFNVRAPNHPFLRRRVETYCFTQSVHTRIERKGQASRTVTDYKYTSVWMDAASWVSSENFKDQKYNQNKRPNFNAEEFCMGQAALFGPVIRINQNVFQQISQQTPLNELTKVGDIFRGQAAKISMADPDGAWQYSPDDGMIRRRAVEGMDSIGDVRISYYVASEFQNGLICSILGKVGVDGNLEKLDELSREIASQSTYSKNDFINQFLKE